MDTRLTTLALPPVSATPPELPPNRLPSSPSPKPHTTKVLASAPNDHLLEASMGRDRGGTLLPRSLVGPDDTFFTFDSNNFKSNNGALQRHSQCDGKQRQRSKRSPRRSKRKARQVLRKNEPKARTKPKTVPTQVKMKESTQTSSNF